MTGTHRAGAPSGTPVQVAAAVIGAVFLLIGVFGFVPGITTRYGDITFSGDQSAAELFGVFNVSVLHNLVHVAFGVAGLVLASTPAQARSYLVGGGLVYLFLWVYGLVVGEESDANFVPFNDADNWLHLVLGVAMVLAGVLIVPGRRETGGGER